MSTTLTLEEATDFFSELFGGEHHLPSKIKEWGTGFMLTYPNGELATFDFSKLTTLVLMAHRDCIRVSVSSRGMNRLIICIWKRDRDAKEYSRRHPTIGEAINTFNRR
jgi:hypothetical protein